MSSSENVNNIDEDLLATIQKGNKKAAALFFEPYRVSDSAQKKDDANHDLFVVNLKELSEDTLHTLHQHTDWLAPSYFLRLLHYRNLKDASDANLITILQSRSTKAKEEMFLRYEQQLEKANDEVLVMMSQEDNDEALRVLVERYLSIVKKTIKKLERKYFFRGLDSNDLVQEGIMGLFKSKDDFKIERKTKFKDFSRHVIEKHMGTLILRSANYKNKVLNESFSYHSPIGNDSEITFEQMLKSESYQPESTYVNKESFYGIWGKLTPLERNVLQLYSEGLSYQEIGELVGKKKKAIDNTIQRIRKKGNMYKSSM